MKRRSSVTLLIVVVLHKKTYKPLSKQCGTTITVLYLVGSMSISHFYLSILYAPINRNTKTVRKLIFSSVLLKKKYTRYYYSKRIFIGFCAKSYKYICIYIYGIWAFVLQKAWPLSCKTLHEGNIGRKGRYSVDFVRLSSTIWTTLFPLSLSLYTSSSYSVDAAALATHSGLDFLSKKWEFNNKLYDISLSELLLSCNLSIEKFDWYLTHCSIFSLLGPYSSMRMR